MVGHVDVRTTQGYVNLEMIIKTRKELKLHLGKIDAKKNKKSVIYV